MSVIEGLFASGESRQTDEAVLVAQGLRVVLTGTEIDVVRDLNIELSSGEILGLVGESGSGKTSAGLALLGFARSGTSIAGGSVTLKGIDVLSLPDGRLRQLRGKLISYVPQDPASWLNPSLRIDAQIIEVLDTHQFGASREERKRRVTEIIEEVKLPSDREFLSRYPHQLSGGEQQRVALAMAFACHPAAVVLDEPTTGLDVTTQAHVLRTVKELAEHHGTAAVYVSHDLAVIAGLAERIAVMYAGRLIEVGPADELIHAGAHPYTRRLIGALPDAKQRRPLVGIPGRAPPLGTRGEGCSFADRCAFAEAECRQGEIDEQLVADSPRHSVRCRRWEFVRASQQVAPPEVAARVSAHNGAPQLELQNLGAWYGDNQVLRDINLAICRGECLALVGESGSGKTTLARCIAGMHRSEGTGEIRLGGAALAWAAKRRSDATRRAVQYIFQNPYNSLNPRKAVRDLLEQPLRRFDCAPEGDYVRVLLDQVALPAGYAQRYPSQLSGGERQRIAIARALAVSPSVLICDEITSALDVSVQASILSLLQRLHAETDLTVLFVTHNLAVVRSIADRVIVLDKGEIVEEGVTDECLDAPKHPCTQTLLSNTPDAD